MNVYLKHKKKDGGAGGTLSVPPCRKGLIEVLKRLLDSI